MTGPWMDCPVCAVPVYVSYSGHRDHEWSVQHRLVLFGFPIALAEETAERLAASGLSVDALLSALREWTPKTDMRSAIALLQMGG